MILVAGSTGVLGFEICQRLRQRGMPVKALVRATSSPEKSNALRALGCEIVAGDLKDRRSLDAACAGSRVVISTVTAITTAKEGDSFAATDGAGNVNLVDAATTAGIEQFIFVSFDADGMPDFPLADAKRDVERRLEQSGMVYTILHPSFFMESWLGPMLFADPVAGTAKIYGQGDVIFRYIAVADVAEVAVQAIDHPAARNATMRFGGPEAMTQREALQVFEQVFGKPFTVNEIPAAALEAQWSAAPDPFSRSFSALMLSCARGPGAAHPAPSEQFPIRLTTVREFATAIHTAESRARASD